MQEETLRNYHKISHIDSHSTQACWQVLMLSSNLFDAQIEELHLEVQIVSQLVSPLSELNIQQNTCAIKTMIGVNKRGLRPGSNKTGYQYSHALNDWNIYFYI